MKFAGALGIAVLGLMLAAAPVSAGIISWTDWTSASAGLSGSASGTLYGGAVTVTYSGEVKFAQTGGGINYWVPSAPYLSPTISNAPPDSDIIAVDAGSVTNTITFSSPVLDPVMALVSLGQSVAYKVYYRFDQPFTLLSSGHGYWGGATPSLFNDGLIGSAYVLRGEEGHGAIQFSGLVTSISWTTDPAENWSGFTVGAPVPEPGTLLLLGGGLSALALRRRRKA